MYLILALFISILKELINTIITDIKLKINGSDQDDKFWRRRGVALLFKRE